MWPRGVQSPLAADHPRGCRDTQGVVVGFASCVALCVATRTCPRFLIVAGFARSILTMFAPRDSWVGKWQLQGTPSSPGQCVCPISFHHSRPSRAGRSAESKVPGMYALAVTGRVPGEDDDDDDDDDMVDK